MLCKLAWGNVRRAGRDYLVYLLTLTLAVTVFYAFNTISVQIDYVNMELGLSELLGSLMSGLTLFLAVVMGFLMVYANNFIMKRRKKEFGLYQVLGMSRGQVARVMALETLIVSGAALVLGIALGLALSQLMVFFTASLFKTQIADFHFFFSLSAFLITVGCLVAIFLVTLLFNLRVVARARIIDLMSAERKNETVKVRNLWLSAALFVVGAVLIGVAYARLLKDGLPLDGDDAAMSAWLVTTAMVLAGTVLFFFGFSGFLLTVLQRARSLYWRGLNMFTMRQLSAKVNTVSFSMAVIAMVLFLAITSVTGGMSIADVMNTGVERCTPADYTRVVLYYSQATAGDYTMQNEVQAGVPMAAPTEPVDIMEASAHDTVDAETGEARPFDPHTLFGAHAQVDAYDALPDGSEKPLVSLLGLAEAAGVEVPKGIVPPGNEGADTTSLQVVSESDYNDYRAFRGMEPVSLGEDGYLLASDMGASVTDIYDAALSKGIEVSMGGRTLRPAAERVDGDASAFTNSTMGGNAGTIIVPDAVLRDADLPLYTSYFLADFAEGVSDEEAAAKLAERRSYGALLNDDGAEIGIWGMEMTRAESYASINSMNGLISYLAIYIGFVLVVASAAILTIQQLSGVSDAGRNCRILSELGTSERAIMHSMLAQQTVFFLFPLAIGLAHSFIALRVVIDLVELFGMLTIGGTVGMTVVIFLAAYGGYFLVTYFMSKGIVREAIRVRHSA